MFIIISKAWCNATHVEAARAATESQSESSAPEVPAQSNLRICRMLDEQVNIMAVYNGECWSIYIYIYRLILKRSKPTLVIAI